VISDKRKILFRWYTFKVIFWFNAHMIEMDQTEKNRYLNCLSLKREICDGKITVFADKVDRKHNQISSLLGKTPTKTIGKRLARHFEMSFDLESGWLDEPHPELWGEDGVDYIKKFEMLIDTMAAKELSRLMERMTARFVEISKK
jgi:hypothetical protein